MAIVKEILQLDTAKAVAELKQFSKAAEEATKELDELKDEAGEAGAGAKQAGADFERAGDKVAASAAETKQAKRGWSELATGVLQAQLAFAAITKVWDFVSSSAQGVVDGINQITDASARSSVGVDALIGLRVALEGSGQSFEQIEPTLNQFPKRLADAAAGLGEAAKGFELLGISTEQAAELATDGDAAFKSLTSQILAIENPAKRAAAAIAIFGEGGGRLIQALGGAELEDFAEFARVFGQDTGPEAAKAAADWQRGIAALKVVLQGLGPEADTLQLFVTILRAGVVSLAQLRIAANDFAGSWWAQMIEIDAVMDRFWNGLIDSGKFAFDSVIYAGQSMGIILGGEFAKLQALWDNALDPSAALAGMERAAQETVAALAELPSPLEGWKEANAESAAQFDAQMKRADDVMESTAKRSYELRQGLESLKDSFFALADSAPGVDVGAGAGGDAGAGQALAVVDQAALDAAEALRLLMDAQRNAAAILGDVMSRLDSQGRQLLDALGIDVAGSQRRARSLLREGTPESIAQATQIQQATAAAVGEVVQAREAVVPYERMIGALGVASDAMGGLADAFGSLLTGDAAGALNQVAGQISGAVEGIGAAVGTAVGSIWGPAGAAVGQVLGQLAGGMLGGIVDRVARMAGTLAGIGQVGAEGVAVRLETFREDLIAGLQELPVIIEQVLPAFFAAMRETLPPAIVEAFKLLIPIIRQLLIERTERRASGFASVFARDTDLGGRIAGDSLFGGTAMADGIGSGLSSIRDRLQGGVLSNAQGGGTTINISGVISSTREDLARYLEDTFDRRRFGFNWGRS